MSRHEGVSCDNCLRSNFREIRFKCLICYDYDLCENCFENKVSTSRHSPSHPMQCILTRKDFDLYYSGEGITVDNPPSLTCPLCGKRGLTESNLHEHVNALHLDINVEVVCPICAAIPTGDPNLVTDDFATHLAIEHNNSSRGMEDQIGGRHMRRMIYPGRSIRGARAQRSANMNFTSGPSSTSGFSNAPGSTTSSLPPPREAMDPIAELLTQLTGVRRNAQQLQQTVSTATQLQELQAQLQLERQRASIIRQQLERFPGKIQTTQNGQQTTSQVVGSQSKTYANAVKITKKESSTAVQEDDDPRLLLPKIWEQESSDDSQSQNIDIFEQSLFVRELIQSLPTNDDSTAADLSPISQPPASARAIPVDCSLFSSSTPLQQFAIATDRDEGSPSQSSSSGSDTCDSLDRPGPVMNDTGIGRSMNGENDQPSHGLEPHIPTARKSESPLRQSPSETLSELKKEPTGVRAAGPRQQQYASSSGAVSGLVRPQPSHPVPAFQVLVSGAPEQ